MSRFAGSKQSLEGHLLIASPTQMHDKRFDRTVILILHHDEKGAMGIILNRPLELDQLQGPLQLLESLAEQGNGRIQLGGPVNGPLIVLRDLSNDDDEKKKGGVYVVSKQEQLEELINQEEAQFQFFIGHAGWKTGQLESEIAQGSWMTTKALPGFVFAHHQDMWIEAIEETGISVYRDILGLTELPDDPTLN